MDKASGFNPRQRRMSDISEEELELYAAYLKGEVTAYQVRMALGRSSGYYYNWCRRCADALFALNRLVIVDAHKKEIRYERKQHGVGV